MRTALMIGLVAGLTASAHGVMAPCCLPDGCMVIETSACVEMGGQVVDGTCEVACPGACCLEEGSIASGSGVVCTILPANQCLLAGGIYGGFQSVCEDACDERRHPGWNHVSFELTLTKNQPTYWSAYAGSSGAAPPFTVLDPGDPPGRPDPEHFGDRVLRGFLVGWAVNNSNEEIRWNHLKGDAILVNYMEPYAWEYNAWAFPVVADVAHGDQSGDPGVLNLDGMEYAPGFDVLILDFYASGSNPFFTTAPDAEWSPVVETDLTLHPISTDLRQEDDGPVTTKAKIDVWNEYEVKFNGLERCITCWDQTLLSNYAAFGLPNNFLFTTLGTNKGKARIDGIRSDNCDFDFEFDPLVPFGADPRDLVSEDAAILGVAAKFIEFIPTTESIEMPRIKHAAAGMNVHGAGTESAVIQYDVLGAPPEAAGSTARRSRNLGRSSARGGGGIQIGGTEGVASSVDRVSGTEKGSLVIFSKIEVRWDQFGALTQDTFIDVTNDFGEDVMVQFYYVNGDPPLKAFEFDD